MPPSTTPSRAKRWRRRFFSPFSVFFLLFCFLRFFFFSSFLFFSVPQLGALSHPFLVGRFGSSTKIDYRKKVVALV